VEGHAAGPVNETNSVSNLAINQKVDTEPGIELAEDIEIWNNPANMNVNPEVRILLTSDSGNIGAGIFDINGREVKMFTHGNNVGDNVLEIKWDCRDDENTKVMPGLYFFAFRGNSHTKVKQIFVTE